MSESQLVHYLSEVGEGLYGPEPQKLHLYPARVAERATIELHQAWLGLLKYSQGTEEDPPWLRAVFMADCPGGGEAREFPFSAQAPVEFECPVHGSQPVDPNEIDVAFIPTKHLPQSKNPSATMNEKGKAMPDYQEAIKNLTKAHRYVSDQLGEQIARTIREQDRRIAAENRARGLMADLGEARAGHEAVRMEDRSNEERRLAKIKKTHEAELAVASELYRMLLADICDSRGAGEYKQTNATLLARLKDEAATVNVLDGKIRELRARYAAALNESQELYSKLMDAKQQFAGAVLRTFTTRVPEEDGTIKVELLRSDTDLPGKGETIYLTKTAAEGLSWALGVAH